MSGKVDSKPQLSFVRMEIKNREAKKTTVMQYPNKKQNNYYRSVEMFGDIASKKTQYPDQPFRISPLKAITQSTKFVEDVVIKVKSNLGETDRDAQAYDIAAKAAGVGGFKDMNNTDAYRFFLEVNSDDFTLRETEYKGQKETKAYLDCKKSDGKITVFSSEIINDKEYLAMRDKKGKVHYFDVKNGLKEDFDVTI